MPPRPPTSPEADLHDTLDLLSQVVASISDRLDAQSEALQAIGKAIADLAQRETGASSFDRGAQATAEAVSQTLAPSLHRIVDALQELGGTKAVLRERMRAVDREEARYGRWRVQPWAVILGIPLVLVLVLALAVPRAVAQTSLTCQATGGTWYRATERFEAACMFPANR